MLRKASRPFACSASISPMSTASSFRGRVTGPRRSEPVTGNQVTLKLTPQPQYLLLGKAGVRPGTP